MAPEPEPELHLELDPVDLSAVAAFLADRQADPGQHIGYLNTEPAAIVGQLRGLEPLGTGGLLVARVDGRIVGVLAAEWDTEPPRCWWHGPFVADDADPAEVAEALLRRGEQLLPATVTEQETCGDDRHAWLAGFARRHGFVAEEASAVLGRELGTALPERTLATVPVEDLDAEQRDAVAALHEQLFPNTHTPGAKLVSGGTDRLLVVLEDGDVGGYVAVERQEDGEGYLDFLGVAPAARGRGLGSALVAAACHEMRDGLGCRATHLTVRVSNAAARKVYANNGFTEERVLVPFRKGYSIP